MLLYSVNVFLKFYIQEQFYGDIHYVWCSEIFDGRKSASYSSTHLIPASSNPAQIYAELKRDTIPFDTHSAKINAQKASFKSFAVANALSGRITNDQRDDILYLSDHAPSEMWRPLLYLIPRFLVEPRLQSVPIIKRAGFGPEYIIDDLKRNEFDIIEF